MTVRDAAVRDAAVRDAAARDAARDADLCSAVGEDVLTVPLVSGQRVLPFLCISRRMPPITSA